MKNIPFGETIAGLLVDGVESTPFAGATLHMTEDRGVRLEVPYIEVADVEQFDHVRGWFNTRTPPANMQLLTHAGVISLFDVRWSGNSMGPGIALGKLAPGETLLGRYDGELADPFHIKSVRSHVDALWNWADMSAVTTSRRTNDKGLISGLSVEVESPEDVVWRQGDATMRMVADWRTEHPSDRTQGGFSVLESVVLESAFDEARPFLDHLVEQQKIVRLLTFLYGVDINFRSHRAKDVRIAERTLGGTIAGYPWVEVISSRTIRDSTRPRPIMTDLQDPLLGLSSLGVEGLSSWAEAQDKWSQFVLPAAGILQRKGAFLEDVVVSTSMSIEAAGSIIGRRPGEEATHFRNRPTTATFVLRCLDLIDVDWGDVATDLVSIARFVATAYNDIKHFDRGGFPSATVSLLVSNINRYIVRLVALHVASPDGSLLGKYRLNGKLWRVEELFKQHEVRLNGSGVLVPR